MTSLHYSCVSKDYKGDRGWTYNRSIVCKNRKRSIPQCSGAVPIRFHCSGFLFSVSHWPVNALPATFSFVFSTFVRISATGSFSVAGPLLLGCDCLFFFFVCVCVLGMEGMRLHCNCVCDCADNNGGWHESWLGFRYRDIFCIVLSEMRVCVWVWYVKIN